MKIRNIMLAGMILLALAMPISIGAAKSDKASEDVNALDDVKPYNGPIGPDNPVYEFKIALQGIREAFTLNQADKIEIQMANQEERLAEVKAELIKKKTEAAERALQYYMDKVPVLDAEIAAYKGTDTGILNARNMTRKHQAVLLRLRESHPDNAGLERAYNNSLRLEEKFRQKIAEREEKENEDHKEDQLKINAEVIGNATNVKVSLKFETNSTDNSTIAQEILDKLQLNTSNISDILKLEEDEEHTTPAPTVTVTGTPTTTVTATPTPEIDEDSEEKLTARAEVENNISDVKFEYKFQLDATNRTEIVEGIYQKLSALNLSEVLNVLEIKVKEEKSRQKNHEIEPEVTKVGKGDRPENMVQSVKKVNKQED